MHNNEYITIFKRGQTPIWEYAKGKDYRNLVDVKHVFGVVMIGHGITPQVIDEREYDNMFLGAFRPGGHGNTSQFLTPKRLLRNMTYKVAGVAGIFCQSKNAKWADAVSSTGKVWDTDYDFGTVGHRKMGLDVRGRGNGKTGTTLREWINHFTNIK